MIWLFSVILKPFFLRLWLAIVQVVKNMCFFIIKQNSFGNCANRYYTSSVNSSLRSTSTNTISIDPVEVCDENTPILILKPPEEFSSIPVNSCNSAEQLNIILLNNHRLYRLFVLLILYSYETLTEQGFQLINCVNLGPCGSVLAEFPDIACTSFIFSLAVVDITWLRIISVILILYTCLLPCSILYHLRKASSRGNPFFAAKYDILYSHFHPQYW